MSDCPRNLSFVDDKKVHFDEIKELIKTSVKANHHTNFGPVSVLLEHELCKINGIEPGASEWGAVCGSSATTLISGAVAALNNKFERRLRWIASDFGFFTNFTGPMENAHHVSCDDRGMLDIEALEDIAPESYDAILVTNVFGACDDFDAYFEFAGKNNKILMIDNAAGFGALTLKYCKAHSTPMPEIWLEIISLHHTKPWGMGEGGAIFASNDLIHYIRASINFGVSPTVKCMDLRWCLNGKMSELAAAAVLSHVSHHETWSLQYVHQTRRVFYIASQAGLMPLFGELPKAHVIGQIAFQSPYPVYFDQLKDIAIPLQKYYRPTSQSGPKSQALYRYMVNVPCHPGMASLSDDMIYDALVAVRELGRMSS
jgi:dTDP-4-amino-4,6-dideoxygalactose transaminase